MRRGYYENISVDERKMLAEASVAKSRKAKKNLNPIIINGTKIAKNWWGISWNKNLERYADYSNRIGRGRSYVRSGSVIDLQLSVGSVSAKVQGSRRKPYDVEIRIEALSAQKWQEIIKQCGNSIEGMEELAAGRFPASLAETFMREGSGIFPTPDEIDFGCSCPDMAYMCKHVAAVLYGIGARFDENPLLFFELRAVTFEGLLKKTVEEKMQSMLKNADKKSSRVIVDTDTNINELFGL